MTPTPHPAAAAGLPEALRLVNRYEPEIFREDRVRMELDQSGDWVKLNDIVAALTASAPAASSAAPKLADALPSDVYAKLKALEALCECKTCGPHPGSHEPRCPFRLSCEIQDLLNTAPAPQAGAPARHVAYLDIGSGGYVDIGSNLSAGELAALPRGRHMLVIAGTFGVDGYKPQGQPQAGAESCPPSYGATEYGWEHFFPLQEGDKRLMALVVSLYGNDHQAFEDLEALVALRARGAVPSDDEIADVIRAIPGLHPWGIGTTVKDAVRVGRAVLARWGCAAVSAPSVPLVALFREALAWGMAYGPAIPAHQWDEMRDTQAALLADRAAAPQAPAGGGGGRDA
ncbi:hypothetical protein [Paracidovorax wautersii]|uniref:Uncharacterized protein n=1 Tax=Paracidovorax wautersii TaxID=1177982 RepID=A0ABU1IG71_9BURK|nr:hypothetical protein [Paracidovorax wautersii]MDR6216232.1 hypothetical protein [Paracidovorax wautersii]